MRVALDAEQTEQGLRRVAEQIAERGAGASDLVLVGIRRGGVPIAEVLKRHLESGGRQPVPLGTVDITLYRDDAATALPNPRIGPSRIPFRLDQKRVVLVDDVAFTGRTVRAALDAIMDFGRPRNVELAVLVERPGRELPIQPDYKVATVAVGADERIDVVDDGPGIQAVVSPLDAPSIPPPRLP